MNHIVKVYEDFGVSPHVKGERPDLISTETCIPYSDGPNVTDDPRLGLLCLQVAKIIGVKKVIICGVNADREKLDADLSVNAEEEDAVEIFKNFTNGLGADVVIEASGFSLARKQFFSMVRRCGKVGLIGLTGASTDIILDSVVEGELEVKDSWGNVWTSWLKAIDLISTGKLEVATLITAKLPLENWQEGFKMMEERKSLKILLTSS